MNLTKAIPKWGLKADSIFYIKGKEPFTGKVIIPGRAKIVTLYGTISRDTRWMTHSRWLMFIFGAILQLRGVQK